jgi:superfamily II DNA or RNA helicase
MKYSYHPIYVQATGEEEESFGRIIRRMAACFVNGVLVDLEEFVKLRRMQLRIISMATQKVEQIDSIIARVHEKDHFIVYCGDGRLFDDNGEELRHIQFIKRRLDAAGHRPNQFTASENMYKRMEIVDSFNIGETTALAAIRCLDEGINIPSIKAALILSSNDSNREFVQRRGRILRKHKNKQAAKIFDVLVLPSSNTPKMAVIEFRRYYEYARLATNSEELLSELNSMIGNYHLTMEQVVGEVGPDVEELDE